MTKQKKLKPKRFLKSVKPELQIEDKNYLDKKSNELVITVGSLFKLMKSYARAKVGETGRILGKLS